MRTHLIAIAALAVVTHAARARAQPSGDLTGTYVGTWGVTTLQQDGAHVTGAYAYHDGQIDGVLTGNTLRFTWTEDDASGRGIFVVADDGELIGTWGHGADDQDGGGWRLAPTALAAALAPPASIAPTVPAAPAPAMGSHVVGVRFPWDGASLPTGAAFGVGGVGVDVGRRVGDRWYLGASADWEAVLSTSLDAAHDSFNRFRVGGELRYAFSGGHGAMSVDDGPWTPIPRHDWLGLRAGAETFDGGATRGTFADVTLGTDLDTGPLGMGLYLSVGASFEPASVFAAPPPSSPTSPPSPSPLSGALPDPSSTTTSPYLTLGMSLLFG